MRRRILALAVGAACAVTPVLALPSASAAPVASATVTGSVTQVGPTSPDVTVTLHITVADAPIDATRVDVTAPAGLAIDAGSATLDGSALAQQGSAALPPYAGVFGTTATGATAYLGSGLTSTSPTTGGELAVGAHTLVFTADQSAARGKPTLSATLGWNDGTAHSATTGALPLPLPDIVVSLPADSGEEQTLPLGTGSEAVFGAQVVDNGAVSTSNTVTVTLPAGLVLDPDDQVAVLTENDEIDPTCTTVPGTAGGTVVTCPVGRLGPSPVIVTVAVDNDGTQPVGTTGTFTVAVTSDTGTDGNPADNSVKGTVRYAGVSHLKTTLTATPARVQVGHSTAVQIRVHNSGPQASALTEAILVALDKAGDAASTHFRVTHFSGKTLDPNSDAGGVLFGVTPQPASTALRSALTRFVAHSRVHRLVTRRLAADPEPIIWDAGTVAAGKDVTATLTLKAVSVGGSQVVALAASPNSDPFGGCTPNDQSCDPIARVTLTAIAAVVPPAHHSPSGSGQAAGVADTGAPSAQLIVLGLLLVLAGAGVLQVARYRGRHTA